MTTSRERVLARLRDDYVYYPEHALRIVSATGAVIPFKLKRPQVRLARALMAQREAGQPQRAIICKARKIGFCLDPTTRILTADDLRWVALEDAWPGLEIVACDENVPGGKGNARKLRRAVVEARGEVYEPAYRITMDDGRELIATAQHRFLCRRRGGTDAQWREVGQMVVGDRIRHVTTPWSEPDLDDAWMGGLLDGEGHLALASRSGGAITMSQCPGAVLDRARAYLNDRDYAYREELDVRPAKPGGKFKGTAIGRLVVSRTNEMFRLIGQTRPTRFIEQSHWWEDKSMPGRRTGVSWSYIVGIEPLGERRMLDIQTSRATFIAEGFVSHNSTQAQGLAVQRASQFENHLAMLVTQDGDTGAEVFDIGRGMWSRLPAEIQPQLAYERNSDRNKFMQFGEPSLQLRRVGLVGLNSRIRIQTAGSAAVDAKGRGMTIRTLHLSESAHWKALARRLALLNAVPDDLDTLVIEESTSNGHNHFKEAWDAAVAGESGYVPIFTPWFEEPSYVRRFANELERGDFEAKLETGPYGEDETDLLVRIPEMLREWAVEWGDRVSAAEIRQRTLEHLNWRRWAIASKCEGDLAKFHQEYPSTAEESFLSTGRRVFSVEFVQRAFKTVDLTDPAVVSLEAPGPVRGLLSGEQTKSVRVERGVTIDVPQRAAWVPRSKRSEGEGTPWRIWTPPRKEGVVDGKRVAAGQYIVACDPMSGEENEGELAEHAITVIDHETLIEVAQYSSRDDPDQVALELLLVALHYNKALIGVEVTGGWGTPIVARLARTYRYPRLFRREIPDERHAKHLDKLGWSTDARTKPMMEARATELLRDHPEIFRSRKLLVQMLTFVRNDRGRSGPEKKKLSDVLMAWMQAQRIAEMTPIRPDRPRGATTYSTTSRVRVKQRAKATAGDGW